MHRFADFEDVHYLDFVLSAAAIARPLDEAARVGVGAAVLAAVEGTRGVVDTNTNLGMILLLAPLAAGAAQGGGLREGVRAVLRRLTVDDARLVYRAIRLARPGGLGDAAEQDVAEEPTVSLLDAMRLAADRDLVARQYAEDYRDIFDLAVPALREALDAGQTLETAIVSCHLALIAGLGDTLIARKLGRAASDEAARRAAAALASGPVDVEAAGFRELDAWLRADGHRRNPGATADLTAAALFVALSDGTIARPLEGWGRLGR